MSSKKSGKKNIQSSIEPHDPDRVKALPRLCTNPDWKQKLHAKGQVWIGARMDGSTVIGECFDSDIVGHDACAVPCEAIIDGMQRNFTCRSGFTVQSATNSTLQISYEQVPNIEITATFQAPSRVYEKGFAKDIKFMDVLDDLTAVLSYEKVFPWKGAPAENYTAKSVVKVFSLEKEETKCEVPDSSEGTTVKFIPNMPQATLVYSIFSSDVSSVKVYNVPKKKLLKVLKGHSSRITELIVANGGRNIYTSAQDGKVLYWDLSRSEPIETLAAHLGHQIHCMAIQTPDRFVVDKYDLRDVPKVDESRSGNVLLYGEDKTLRIISLQNSKQKLFDHVMENETLSCCTFLDHPYFACGTLAGRISYFDWRNPSKPVWEWSELRGSLHSMGGYGKSVICGANDGSCFLRDPVSNKINDGALEFCGGETDAILRCCVSGGKLLTCSPDGKIRRYDLG